MFTIISKIRCAIICSEWFRMIVVQISYFVIHYQLWYTYLYDMLYTNTFQNQITFPTK